MKDKPVSFKKLSWILPIVGIVLIGLYFVAKNGRWLRTRTRCIGMKRRTESRCVRICAVFAAAF